MRKLTAFVQVSLDGYFAGSNGDLSWAHRQDPEFQAFVAENAKGGGVLLFGRKTYEMMIRYWPTPIAKQNEPVVAEHINSLPKIVFSKTLQHAAWNNTLVRSDLVNSVRQLKEESGQDMVILGSGSIVSQLAKAGLIDEIQLVVNPLALGEGKRLFDDVGKLPLKLTRSRTFGNGNVLLCYAPA